MRHKLHDTTPIAIVGLIMATAFVGFAEDKNRTLSIIESIAENETAISTLSTEFSYVMTVPSRKDPERLFNSRATQKFVAETTSIRGRVRCEISGTSVSRNTDGTEYPMLALGVFDGDTVKVQSGGTKYLSGILSNDVNDVPLQFDPRQITSFFGNDKISDILLRYKGKVAGNDHISGIDTIVMETEPVRSGLDRRSRFWVAPSLNFAVVCRTLEARFIDHVEWIEYRRIEGASYREVDTGIWLPLSGIFEERDIELKHATGDVTPPLLKRFDLTFEKWVVNPTISDDLFRFEFEQGIYVNDNISDQKKVEVAKENDLMIQDQAIFASKAKTLGISKRGSYTSLVIINCFIAGCVIIGIAIRAIRSRR